MLHAEKSRRNRTMNNDVNSGNNADVITKEKLIKGLDIHSCVLKDTSSIGRMKDSYPIHLFQIQNAYFNKNISGLYLKSNSDLILQNYYSICLFIVQEHRKSTRKHRAQKECKFFITSMSGFKIELA